MNLMDAIGNHLTGWPGIAPLIGDRCYRRTLPQDPVYPAITYQRNEGTREFSHSGDSALSHVQVRISCWAQTDADAEALADQVRVAMRGWRAAYGGAAFPEYPVDMADSAAGVVQLAVDVAIWWKE